MIDMMRTVDRVRPRGRLRQSQSLVDRRGHVLGSLRIKGRIPADLVARPHDRAAFRSAAGEEDGLHRPPVVAEPLASSHPPLL